MGTFERTEDRIAPFKSLLEETPDSWRDVRESVIEEVETIPAKRFDFRPTDEVRSVTELIQHILEVALMMTGELTRPDTDFRRAPWPELIDQCASHVKRADDKPRLIDLLHTSIEEAERRFREAGELAMLQFITRFDGERGTRLAWLEHGIAQEI